MTKSEFRAGPVAVWSLWGPYNAGNFLGYRETNDFSREAELFGVSEAAECYCASVLKMVTEGLWEMLLNYCQSTRRHISEYNTVHIRWRNYEDL
jgi:hypothetical protein